MEPGLLIMREKNSKSGKRSRRRWAFLGVYVLALFAFQEIVIRFLFPLPEVGHINRIHYMPIAPGGEEVKALRSVRALNISSPDRARFVYTLNRYGFRDRNWRIAKSDGVERVLFVGDSFVQGDMAGEEETIPRCFEAASAREGVGVESMNFGVDGAAVRAFVNIVLDATPVFHPDWVFLVLFANDLPSVEPNVYEQPYMRHSRWVPRFVQLVAMIVNDEMIPSRWAWRTVRTDQPVPSPNNPWSDEVYEREMKAYVTPEILAAMKRGDFNPFRIGGSAYLEERLQRPSDLSIVFTLLKRFTHRNGARLCVFYIPDRGQVTRFYQRYDREFSIGFPDDIDLTRPEYRIHQKSLTEQCESLGVPFLDLTPLIEAEEKSGHHLYWNYDDHLRAEGYQLVGNAMYEFYRSLDGDHSEPR
ncbi:MAG: hypothetical protein ACC661_02025 [Verrucomicrobiales bacterium]